MAEDGYKVMLNVYDLSQGLARQLSTTFLGKAIEGIWHTGIVVYGNEYFFGGGIQCLAAGRSAYGKPVNIVELGVTHVPRDLFEEYLNEISPRYTMETYDLFNHNCNNFSNEVAQFLLGATIPDYILQLPNEVLNSPFSSLILPMIRQLESTLKVGAVPQAPQFNPMSSSVQSSNAKPTPLMPDSAGVVKSRDPATGSGEVPEKASQVNDSVQPAVDLSSSGDHKAPSCGQIDLLGEARNKVQDEITKEFTILMASGTLGASEAATLAARRVMQRYGRINAARG